MDLSPSLVEKLEHMGLQRDELERQLLDPDVLADHERVRSLSIRKRALDPVVDLFRSVRAIDAEIDDHRSLVRDGMDRELAELAEAELPGLRERLAERTQTLLRTLLTADEAAVGSVIVEIRAGVGGDEAALWAGDLAAMYRSWGGLRGWTIEVLDAAPGEMGGVKHMVLRVEGEGVWSSLGYEGGTHQVKRVPATETQGRIHTSTATVAVLPEPADVDVQLDPNDVRESITTAQGPGGQNVNKVATAVHLIHVPSGIEVRMQDTKSQAQNRQKAWALLKARLYERQRAEAEARRAEARASMIGSGSRAEKIRTYRFKDDIVVDHRLGASFNLSSVLAGQLDDLVGSLAEEDTARRLAAL